jgi:hypothetical protein
MGFKIADISDKTKSVTQMLKKNKFILIALIAGILILLLPGAEARTTSKR